MKKTKLASIALMLTIGPGLLQGQGRKDPLAVEIIKKSIEAMGGAGALASIQDSTAEGTLSIFRGNASTTASITIKTRGPNLIRTEVTSGGKQRIHIQRRDLAWLIEGGKSRALPLHNTYNRHVEHIPLFSQLQGHGNPDVTLKHLGLGRLGNSQVHIIDYLREDPPGRRSGLSQFSLVEFLIDSSSFLPLRVRYFLRADKDAQAKIMVENVYSDYRQVGGVVLPFQMDRFLGAQKALSLKITSIAFNRGLGDDQFDVP